MLGVGVLGQHCTVGMGRGVHARAIEDGQTPGLGVRPPSSCGGLGILVAAQIRPFPDRMARDLKNGGEPYRIGNTRRPFGIFLEQID